VRPVLYDGGWGTGKSLTFFNSVITICILLLQLFFCVVCALFCMMEAAPAPEPQGVNIPAIVAGAAIGKAIAVKGTYIIPLLHLYLNIYLNDKN
jgi:hypothetical protein